MAISAVNAGIPWNISPEMTRGIQMRETWTVTGSTGIVGDSTTITPDTFLNVIGVVGPFTWSVSGSVITLTALDALGNNQTSVDIIGS